MIHHVIQAFSNNPNLNIHSILLTGSQLEPSTVDFWSDTDLIILLAPHDRIDQQVIEDIIKRLGLIIGREVYISQHVIKQRLVILLDSKIERLDIQVCTFQQGLSLKAIINKQYKLIFGTPLPAPHLSSNSAAGPLFSKVEFHTEKSDQIWFLFFECVKKFMRNDHLIGLDLLLELLKKYLAFEMVARDQQYGTTIHRRGYSERIPASIEPSQIRYDNKMELLDYLKHLTIEFAQILANHMGEDQHKAAIFIRYIEDIWQKNE